MNNPFSIDFSAVRRIAYVMLAALLVAAGLPMLQPTAQAAQFEDRSIQLSDSANSGTSITSGVGSGTAVTYRISFTTGAATADSMIIDFCASTPIINDACASGPTGMVTTGAAISAVGSGVITASDWTITTPSASQIRLAKGSGASLPASSAQQVDITGITNPSTVGTFYARMYTFPDTTFGTYASVTSVGNFVDQGGIALSTVRAITITARVQEQLTFCLTSAAHATWTDGGGPGPNADSCAAAEVAAGTTAVTLGHGSPTATLDSSVVDTSNLYSQMSTNATNGAVVNLRTNQTACANAGGLSADGGTTCAIPPHTAGLGTGATAMTAGTAAFGLFVSASAAGPGGVGSLTPNTAYHDAAHVTVPTTYGYGMDSTTAASNGGQPATNVGNVTTTFGSTIAATTAPNYRANSTFVFAATASLTTPAGIYTANLSMIATGTF